MKKYKYEDMMTPYEKFKSLENAESYLKEGTSFKELDAIAYEISDNEAAKRLQNKRKELFKTINEECLKSA